MVTSFKIHCFVYEDVTYFRWSKARWYIEMPSPFEDLALLDLHGHHEIEKAFQEYQRKERLSVIEDLIEGC